MADDGIEPTYELSLASEMIYLLRHHVTLCCTTFRTDKRVAVPFVPVAPPLVCVLVPVSVCLSVSVTVLIDLYALLPSIFIPGTAVSWH